MKSYIIDNVVERNEKVDRPEQDWNSNKGRAVIYDLHHLRFKIIRIFWKNIF